MPVMFDDKSSFTHAMVILWCPDVSHIPKLQMIDNPKHKYFLELNLLKWKHLGAEDSITIFCLTKAILEGCGKTWWQMPQMIDKCEPYIYILGLILYREEKNHLGTQDSSEIPFVSSFKLQ